MFVDNVDNVDHRSYLCDLCDIDIILNLIKWRLIQKNNFGWKPSFKTPSNVHCNSARKMLLNNSLTCISTSQLTNLKVC